MKRFEDRVAYQGSAQSQGFNPVQAPDVTPLLRENMQTQQRSMDNVRQARLQEMDLNRLTNLAAFSETLSSSLIQQAEQQNKKDQAEGLALAYEQGLPTDEVTQHQQQVEGLRKADDVLQNETRKALEQGVPYEAATQFKNLSGWKAYGYAMGRAKLAGENYGAWMAEKLQDFNGDPAQYAAAMAELRNQYFTDNGLTGLNRVLLAEHVFPTMRQSDAKLMAYQRKQYAIDTSFVAQQDAVAEFGTTNDFARFLTALSTTVDENGNPLGYRGAWQYAEKHLIDRFDAGSMNEQQLQAIESMPDPQTGKPFGERWKTRFQLLREKLASHDRANYADYQAEKDIAFAEDERKALELAQSQQLNSVEIAALQKQLFANHQRKSDKLDTYASNYSIDAEQKQRLDEQFKSLAEQRLLTPEMVRNAPWDIQKKWMSVAEDQAKQNASAGNFKTELKAIENFVKNTPNVKVAVDGSTGGLATLVVGDLQNKFTKRVTELIGSGAMTPSQAAQQAAQEVMAEFTAGITNTGSKYFMNQKTGEFVNFFPKNSAAVSRQLNAKLDKIRNAVKYGGKASLDTPGLVFNANELKAMEQGYGEPGWQVPPVAAYWASYLNMNPLDLINRQRKAAGMKDLPTPGSLELIRGTIRPDVQRLLNSFQSPNRSTRALNTIGRFEPTLVPKNYGATVQQAAQKHGIDPSILAGLLESESRWDPKARSKSGAVGIAQIMPEYHPGVDPTDPIASINYAAKYLSQLQRQFGGDMRLALTAYNAGPNAVAKYRGPIPGDRESNEYYGKVMKAAAKYGYGNAWRDPGTMRPRFAASITFDSGQPGIDVYFNDKQFTSVLPGRVKEVGNQTTSGGNGYGNYIVVESVDPLTNRPVDVLYAHLDSISVREGQRIGANTVLGRQGGTGRVVSADGTIASIDFLAPAPKGSKSMTPYSGYQKLRSHIANQLRG